MKKIVPGIIVLAACAAVAQEAPRKAVVVLAPPRMVSAPPCVPRQELAADELERLYRFASIPNGFSVWEQRDCYPRRVDDPTLARITNPVGLVVNVGGRDALVVDTGAAWLSECASSGLSAGGPQPVTGADVLSVSERLSMVPELSGADIREIGVAKAGRARGEGTLYALYLGTARTVVRVQCFEDVGAMLQRAAAALREGEAAASR